jgi:hypothetical protein
LQTPEGVFKKKNDAHLSHDFKDNTRILWSIRIMIESSQKGIGTHGTQ